MRGHSWIRQNLGDDREPMNLEVWFEDPRHMMTWSPTMITETKLARRHQKVIPELKLTKKVTVDEEGAIFKLPRIVFEVSRSREVERRRFYVLSSDIEVSRTTGSALLTSQGEATGFPEQIGMTILAGEARGKICKDRVAERKRGS